MADVIFKGSAEGGRKPANSAEVTLFLDNKARVFGHDADEVQVTRRVFRSGEGEYGINGQPCRLKDVKDLFRGTGVGVDAYSLIEQGKVDRLLQASAKDRRGIFEEAAGISRFKAKKVEAERRMQRVDQNMVRLHDIVDEVGKRLATLKGQATKANRYWLYRGTPWYVQPPAGTPPGCSTGNLGVNRTYNQGHLRNDPSHRYTTSDSTMREMEREGWVYEGMAMCARP